MEPGKIGNWGGACVIGADKGSEGRGLFGAMGVYCRIFWYLLAGVFGLLVRRADDGDAVLHRLYEVC